MTKTKQNKTNRGFIWDCHRTGGRGNHNEITSMVVESGPGEVLGGLTKRTKKRTVPV